MKIIIDQGVREGADRESTQGEPQKWSTSPSGIMCRFNGDIIVNNVVSVTSFFVFFQSRSGLNLIDADVINVLDGQLLLAVQMSDGVQVILEIKTNLDFMYSVKM